MSALAPGPSISEPLPLWPTVSPVPSTDRSVAVTTALDAGPSPMVALPVVISAFKLTTSLLTVSCRMFPPPKTVYPAELRSKMAESLTPGIPLGCQLIGALNRPETGAFQLKSAAKARVFATSKESPIRIRMLVCI